MSSARVRNTLNGRIGTALASAPFLARLARFRPGVGVMLAKQTGCVNSWPSQTLNSGGESLASKVQYDDTNA